MAQPLGLFCRGLSSLSSILSPCMGREGQSPQPGCLCLLAWLRERWSCQHGDSAVPAPVPFLLHSPCSAHAPDSLIAAPDNELEIRDKSQSPSDLLVPFCACCLEERGCSGHQKHFSPRTRCSGAPKLNVLQLDAGVVAEGSCVEHREVAPWTSVGAKMRSVCAKMRFLSSARPPPSPCVLAALHPLIC